MSSKDKILQRRRLDESLRKAHLKMLRDKALHGQQVIYCDSQGEPVIVDARKALDSFLEKFPEMAGAC
ncbi:MAG: hypothetical protein K2H83_07025 [Duncaniella sp.]|nr:hypothetical protein [Duncaniella sp.]MDE5734877.1 hypothetical protein [Duncaniella sp.]MDE6177698.1 hypothetical protein [Duncaniella sp.]MDE6389866.1 hypothetical protein [Duncaniella sp.]